MARVIVISCDRCKKPQSDQNPVRPATVVGTPTGSPRVGRIDLCIQCRLEVVKYAGYDDEAAKAIVKAHQLRGSDE